MTPEQNPQLEITFFYYEYNDEKEGFIPTAATLKDDPISVTKSIIEILGTMRQLLLGYADLYGTFQIPILDLDNTCHMVLLDDIPIFKHNVGYRLNDTNIEVTANQIKINEKTQITQLISEEKQQLYTISQPLSIDLCNCDTLTTNYHDGYLYGTIPNELLDTKLSIKTDFFNTLLTRNVINNMLDNQVEITTENNKTYITFDGNFLSENTSWYIKNGDLIRETTSKENSQDITTRITEMEYRKQHEQGMNNNG